MADFNPDREGHVKHKWLVQTVRPGQENETVKTSQGELKLSPKGRCLITDPALAAEVRQEYARDLAVSRLRVGDGGRTHYYFFGQWPEMPWKKKQVEEETDNGDLRELDTSRQG